MVKHFQKLLLLMPLNDQVHLNYADIRFSHTYTSVIQMTYSSIFQVQSTTLAELC